MSVHIIGAGAYVPDRVIDNVRITAAIPGWDAAKVEQKLGIRERRFLWDIDTAAGKAIEPPPGQFPRGNTDMSQIAVERALAVAGVRPQELDGVVLVSCSPDELNFCHDAMVLHQRLGMRPEAFALHVDSGCGGALYMIDHARKMIESGASDCIVVVASNLTSAYLDREVFTSSLRLAPGQKPLSAYLTMYLFGDGAGAVVLRKGDSDDRGFLASYSGCEFSELVVRKGGGASFPPNAARTTLAHHSYVVNGPLVATAFPPFMKRCIDEVLPDDGRNRASVDRYYLHQANKRLVEAFARSIGLPMDRLAMHMDRYGNVSAAGTLILLAEDVADGTVSLGGGQLVLFAAIGAGSHYAGHLVRL